MPERFTPTQFARQKGRPVRLLGSLRAVLEAIPVDGVLVVANLAEAQEAAAMVPGPPRNLQFIPTSSGTEPFYRLPPETVIGVAPDAYRGAFNREAWGAILRVIQSRFATVHFG